MKFMAVNFHGVSNLTEDQREPRQPVAYRFSCRHGGQLQKEVRKSYHFCWIRRTSPSINIYRNRLLVSQEHRRLTHHVSALADLQAAAEDDQCGAACSVTMKAGVEFPDKDNSKVVSTSPPATDNVMAVNILFIFLNCLRGSALSPPCSAASQAPALFYPSLSF